MSEPEMSEPDTPEPEMSEPEMSERSWMLASGRRAATSRRVLLATPCTITVRAPTGTSCARSVNACDISNRGNPIAPGVALEVPSLLEALRFPNLTRAFVAIPVRWSRL